MTVHEEELLRRIRELEKKNGYLNQQLKEHRYGLTWIDVPEAFDPESANKIPVLEEVKDKSFTDGSEKPTHILIEGDNYHALTCLQYTHKGKIDVIYIDPPYNTGSDGFTYKDKRILEKYPDGTPVPKDHPLRHSYWLSFMQKRLELAKNLLSDDGVIFISIDDNEQANLKLLCDKVFGNNNYVDTLHWKRKKQPSFLAKHTAKVMEYVLVYAKKWDNLGKLSIETLSDATKKVVNLTNQESIRHFSKGVRVKCGNSGVIKKGKYTIKTMSVEYLNNVVYENGETINDVDVKAMFSVSQEKIDSYISQKLLFITANYGLRRDVAEEETNNEKAITDLLLDWGDNQDSEKELKDIFQDKLFGYSKPIKLISNLLKSASDGESIVLDFFAGSGTTLHATLKLNAEDGGSRQCIMVQQNEGEKRICEEVTYERNRRVMQGYTNAKGEQVAGLGGSLKYYRTAFTGTGNPLRDPLMLPSDEDRISLAKNAGVLVSLAENTLYEIFRNEYYQIFTNNQGRFAAVYLQEDLKHFEDFKQEMEKLDGNVTVYIFSWGNNPDAANAFMHLPNVNVKSYPNAILDAYKSAMQQIENQK